LRQNGGRTALSDQLWSRQRVCGDEKLMISNGCVRQNVHMQTVARALGVTL
jgi:hypothetical protein